MNRETATDLPRIPGYRVLERVGFGRDQHGLPRRCRRRWVARSH